MLFRSQGAQVEIYNSDDTETFSKVFQEYIKSDEFQTLPMPTQDYISDVFNAMVSFGKAPDALQNLQRNKVFPVVPQETGKVDETLMGTKSMPAQLQTLVGTGNQLIQEGQEPAYKALAKSITDAGGRAEADGISNYGRAGVNPRMGGVGG